MPFEGVLMEGNHTNFSYFHYRPELQVPVFIRFGTGVFTEELEQLLVRMGFTKIQTKDVPKVEDQIESDHLAKLLTISEASTTVARQIESSAESDRYGKESIIPKPGYRVYRYHKVALMIYSLAASKWQLGVYSDFGAEEKITDARIVLGRFLGWALANHGILGIWGSPVDEGIVVMRPQKSQGEFVLLDIKNRKVISFDKVLKMKPLFSIMKLDSTLRGRNIRMNREEYISFLLHNSTFFDYSGPTVAVRQMVQTLAKISEGLLHPEESFRPRTNLSL